jgi:hypothetical protein
MPQSVSNPGLTPYTFTFTANVTPSTYNHADAPKQEPSTPSTSIAEDPSLSPELSKKSKKRKLSDSDGENPLGQFYSPSIPMQQKQDSHSRRVPEGHIPRPPNAFILFRSDLVQRKAVPSSLEAGACGCGFPRKIGHLLMTASRPFHNLQDYWCLLAHPTSQTAQALGRKSRRSQSVA